MNKPPMVQRIEELRDSMYRITKAVFIGALIVLLVIVVTGCDRDSSGARSSLDRGSTVVCTIENEAYMIRPVIYQNDMAQFVRLVQADSLCRQRLENSVE